MRNNTVYEGWESKPRKKRKKLLIIGLILGMLLLLFLGNLNYNQRINTTGRVVEDVEVSSADIEIAEQIADKEIVSNVDVREVSDVSTNINSRIMEFEVPEGKISLEFDLLDYADWVEQDVENEVDAENFDIQVQESAEKYKWGYDVKLNSLDFMARIDVSSDSDIIIIDNQTLKIGKNYLSFADLTEQGYIVRVEEPVVLDEVAPEGVLSNESNLTQEFVNITETNISITDQNISDEDEINITELEVNVTTNVTVES
ncbi:MAG: hypothetical protein QF567_03180, partial [Candidatus Pacearchaeota archaeon]|nr:hypothetical protein [Candidatus Pacearchaeota archaeon]